MNNLNDVKNSVENKVQTILGNNNSTKYNVIVVKGLYLTVTIYCDTPDLMTTLHQNNICQYLTDLLGKDLVSFTSDTCLSVF